MNYKILASIIVAVPVGVGLTMLNIGYLNHIRDTENKLLKENKEIKKEIAASKSEQRASLKYAMQNLQHFEESKFGINNDVEQEISDNYMNEYENESLEPVAPYSIADLDFKQIQWEKNATFKDEPIDHAWAQIMKDSVWDYYQNWSTKVNMSNSEKPRFIIDALECKSQTCRFSVSYEEGVSANEGMEDVFDLLNVTSDCGFSSLPFDQQTERQEWYIECSKE